MIRRPGKATSPCKVCGEKSRHIASTGKVYSYCTACKNSRRYDKPRPEYHKAWREANVDKCNMYRETRRARERNAFTEEVNPISVLTRYNGLCGICNRRVNPERFHIDHIVALSNGGEHSYMNTQPAHPTCNLRKGAR